jgi:hypothetical protein
LSLVSRDIDGFSFASEDDDTSNTRVEFKHMSLYIEYTQICTRGPMGARVSVSDARYIVG